MSDLLIFDPDDNLLAILSNDSEGACPHWGDPYRELLNQGSEFRFTTVGDHEDSKYIVAENQVAFFDKDNALRLFVIKELEKIDGSDGPQIIAVCEPGMNELNEEIIEDVRPYNTTLKDAQTRTLAGTRWKPGITAELGLNSTNYYYINVTEAIEKNINTWGGELRDRIELNADGNKIAGRYIDSLPRRGADTGKLWEMDKDILSIRQKVQSYPKTALYGRGASLEIEDDEGNHTGGYTRKISFADVEWKVSNGDPVDKPLGQEWVGDPGALALYGRKNEDDTKRHRKGIYENGEQEDPEQLLWETWQALQEEKHPLENYEMDVFLLEELTGHEHEKVRLGDTTIAIAREFADPIEVEERVIEYEYLVSDPDNTGSVVLGQYIDPYFNESEERLDKIESQLNNGIGIWNQGGGPITDDNIKNVPPGTPANVIANGLFESIMLSWDYNSAIYIAHYEVYASEIMGFTPDASNLVWRGKVSMYTHKANSNEQWYFRVRSVNTHGVVGDFSNEVSAQTVRIISDDILFGEIIADHLADGLDIADKLAQNTIDRINAGPMQEIVYTKQEIAATESRLLAQLNSEIGDVNSSISSLNTVADNLKTRADDTDLLLSQHGGKFTSIETEINSIEGRLSASITSVERIDGTVNSHSVKLLAQADLINAKLDNLTYQSDKAGIVSSIEANTTELNLVAEGLNLRVTKEEFNALEIGGRNLLRNSDFSKGLEEWSPNQKVTMSVVDGKLKVVSNQDASTPGFRPTEQISLPIGTYTLSMKVDKRNTNNSSTISTSGISDHRGAVIQKEYGDWTIFSQTFSVTTSKLGYFYFFFITPSIGDSIIVEYVQLERGNKATDHANSPEDTEAEITAVRDRITKTETTLEVHAGQITAKAEKSDVYTKSEMNTSLGKKVDTTTYSNKIGQLDVSISGISGKVTSAETKINTLTGEMSTAKSNIAAIDLKADGISTSVSTLRNDLSSTQSQVTAINVRADGIEQTVKNIQIGGRNLLLNSKGDSLTGWANWVDTSLGFVNYDNASWIRVTKSGSRQDYGINTPFFRLKAETNYVISFTIRSYLQSGYSLNYIYLRSETGTIKKLPNVDMSSNSGFIGDVSVKGLRVWFTFSHNEDIENARILVGITNSVAGSAFLIKETQIEEGTLPSSWTLAPEEMDQRMIKAESSITQLSDDITFKVGRDEVVARINLSPEGVRIDGNKHHITGQTLIDDAVIGTASIANAAITRVKLGTAVVGTLQVEDGAIARAKIGLLAVDDARIANISVNKLLAGEIDTSKIKIRGGSTTDYALIDGPYIESRGRYTRTWQNKTETHDVSLRFQNGYFRAQNLAADRNLYYSDFGISTYASGSQDESSGTIEFFSYDYHPTRKGVTISSVGGVAALRSSLERVIIDAYDHAYLKSNQQQIRLQPRSHVTGNNTFAFHVVDNAVANEQDGILFFGSENNAKWSSGLRFSKTLNSNTLYITDGDGVRGAGSLEVNNIKVNNRMTGAIEAPVDNAYAYVNNAFRVMNKTGTALRGLEVGDALMNDVIVNSIRTANTSENFYIGTGSFELRVTNNQFYNGGNTVYRPVRASGFPTGSMAEYKQDIHEWKESALEMIRNATIYEYHLRSEVESGIYRKRQGLVIGDAYNTPTGLIDGDGVEQYLMNSWNMRAIQEVDVNVTQMTIRVDDIQDDVNRLKLENQFFRQTIESQNNRIKHLEKLLEVA